MKTLKELREKSVSQQQQKLMGLALAYKRGEVGDDEVSDEVKKIANTMSTKDLEDFAKTKHKGLPKKVDEYGGPPISRKDYLKQKPMQESSLKSWSNLRNQLDERVSRREFAKLEGTFKDSISKNIIEFDENGMGFVVEDKRGNVHEFEYKNMNVLNENVEDEMPASPDEKRMAMKQAEFIQYVGREIGEHLAANKEFPEWMQNKLSALHQKAKDMHSTLGAHGGEEGELDESFKLKKGDTFEHGIVVNGVKVTLARRGRGMAAPVVVYIDGKEWKIFKTRKMALKMGKEYAKSKGDMKESVELDESVKKVDNLSQLPKGVEKPLVSMDKVRKEVKMRGMEITHISHNKSGKVIGVSAKADNGTVFTYVNNKGVKESVELDESVTAKIYDAAMFLKRVLGFESNYERRLRNKRAGAKNLKNSDIEGFVKDAEPFLNFIKDGKARYYKSMLNKLKKMAKSNIDKLEGEDKMFAAMDAVDQMIQIRNYISRNKPSVNKESVELDEAKTIKVSFHSPAAKKKWMKKQSISPKEIISQSSTMVELPSSMKQYTQKKDHDEIFQVKESVEPQGSMTFDRIRNRTK